MKPAALFLGIFVSAVLLGAAGLLYTLAASSSATPHRDAIAQVRNIEQLASSWSVETARVKADPLADFDALTAFLPRMARLKEALSDATLRIPDLPDRLAADVQAFLSAVAAREERIERFKTGYAVVRNSARFLPLAAATVSREAEAAGDAALSRSIAMLVQDLNLYLATPVDEAAERLRTEMSALREASLAQPPPLANALANLLAHAEVLLDRHAPTEALFAEATSNAVTELANRLAGSFEFELARHEARAATYERAMLAALGVLALFWVGLAVQQRSRGAPAAASPEPRDARTEPVAGTLPDAHVESDRPLPALALPNALGDPSLGAIDRELAAALTVPLSAENALLYRFRAERVGENITATAERLVIRMEHMRRVHEKLRGGLQRGEELLDFSDGPDLDEELEAGIALASQAHREVNAIADLGKRLTSYSGLPNGDAERDMVDVNACIEEVLAATRADDDAIVARRLGEVPDIFASRTEIRLLLAQVLDNSVRAIKGVEDRRPTIKIDTAQRNDEVLITVIDNGPGITHERRAHIFRPFYTSRDGAMGLGLTLAGSLVKKYEGAIKVNSLPGQGTVIRITLPTGVPGP